LRLRERTVNMHNRLRRLPVLKGSEGSQGGTAECSVLEQAEERRDEVGAALARQRLQDRHPICGGNLRIFEILAQLSEGLGVVEEDSEQTRRLAHLAAP